MPTALRFVIAALLAGCACTERVFDSTAVRSASLQRPALQRHTAIAATHRAKQAHLSAANSRKASPAAVPVPPSMYWAILANFLYFLSLGMNAINMAFLVSQVTDGTLTPSPQSIALSGRIEAVDKFLTFVGVGLLSSMSDVKGRKPLMQWSALGFGLTNLMQAATRKGAATLYLADLIDGCSSCMTPICQAYVADCSPPEKRATNLGIFQGLSIGIAFVFAFPIGGILGAKLGPRVPMLVAAAIQLLNFLIITFLTPESHPAPRRKLALDPREANPAGLLAGLFTKGALLRGMAISWFLLSLARCALDEFVNYTARRFGWTQEQAGPVMVLVGTSVAIAPRLLVPLLGMRLAILAGLLVFGVGLSVVALAPTPMSFMMGILVVSVGTVCMPSLQAFITNMAQPEERGAVLGALGSVEMLTAAIGSTMYSSILAYAVSETNRLQLPGLHFLVAAALVLLGLGVGAVSLNLPEAQQFL